MTRAMTGIAIRIAQGFTVATNNRVGIGSDAPTTKLDVDGALNVSGNAAFGGVITYEDVTDIDSVGVITARSGLKSKNLQFGVTGTGRIDTSSGNLTLDSAGGYLHQQLMIILLSLAVVM